MIADFFSSSKALFFLFLSISNNFRSIKEERPSVNVGRVFQAKTRWLFLTKKAPLSGINEICNLRRLSGNMTRKRIVRMIRKRCHLAL